VIKSDIVERVAESTNFPKAKAKEIVDAVFDEIFNALVRGEKVTIRGFGVFEVVRSNRTKGRDLRTGKEVLIEPKNVVKFRPSKNIKRVIEK